MKLFNLSSAVCGLLFAGVAAMYAPHSMAAIVYDNGAPDTVNGFYITGNIGGFLSTTADNFMLTNAGSVDGVGFYFQNFNGITGWDGNITYAIRSDAAGAPGIILTSGIGQNVTAVDSTLPWCCGGGNAWLVTFDLQSTFAAAGGTDYWLELGGAGGQFAWWVSTSQEVTPGFAWAMGNGGNPGFEFDRDAAFFLTGSTQVPEPASLALLGLGLAGLWARRKLKA